MKIVATEAALHFFEPAKVVSAENIYTDKDEYAVWRKRGDPVLHIQLREWADVLLIAPLSANSLASLANGISNNLLVRMISLIKLFTCFRRAWCVHGASQHP